MSHIFGINWMRYHPDNRVDLAHVERMQYKSILLYEWMWADRDFCLGLVSAAPKDCIFLLRDHPLSEQKADMYAAPGATGQRHAMEWADKEFFVPAERSFVLGINEPDSNKYPIAIDIYNTEFVKGLDAVDLRAAGWSFGVGHPSTVDLQPSNPVDWSWYKASADALRYYGGIADFHAYGSYNGHSWDHHLARVASCPYELHCIFSEFGIDEGIANEPGKGWKQHFNADQYMRWLDVAQVGVRERLAASKLTLLALNLFCYDSNRDWFTFDVREARQYLEDYPWAEPVTASPPNTIHIPVVSVPPVAPPVPPTNLLFDKSLAFVLGEEGGFSSDPNDLGNWKDGKFVGTKYGISGAVWGGQYDIANLTKEQATEIYRQHYWRASGADAMDWPLCLLHFDTAVQFGVGAANRMYKEAGGDPWLYVAERLESYAGAQTWHYHGQAWIRRMVDLMRETK